MSQSAMPHPLAERFPRTVAAFAAMGATEHLERIAHLDAVWRSIRDVSAPPSALPRLHTLCEPMDLPAVEHSFDLIYAGGGLGLLHAAVMAQRYGYQVLVFDRSEVGCAHREWNISQVELAQLVEVGFCSWDELADVVMAEYERGVVRFWAAEGRSSELWMRDVLNVALDAGALLRLARRKLLAAGGVVRDQRELQRVLVSSGELLQVVAELRAADGSVERYGARLLLDGMGSTSPLAQQRFGGAPFAGVCPTVGTVASGFVAGSTPDTHDPSVGDILISVADAQRGQQYLWEGFPGRGDDLTVYLFYYDTLAKRANPKWPQETPSLLELFEDYFALLPSYKQLGPSFRHQKPVYGYIPARHSLQRQEMPLLRGVLPIGDSAAQQSPLTFCGFGAHVRNLGRTTSLLDVALRQDLLEPQHLRWISSYQANVALHWVFSRFMQPWRSAGDVNRLQQVFLQVLNARGEAAAQRFFRDQMRWGDYHPIILGMFWRHPLIVVSAWQVLGAAGIRRWIGDYLRFCGAAAMAALGRRLGVAGRVALLRLAERAAPSWGLAVRARFAEWRVMGWLE